MSPCSLACRHRPDSLWLALVAAALAMLLSMVSLNVHAAEDLPTFKLLMKNGKLYPEVVEVPANTRFRLQVTNEGPGAAEFESLDLRKEVVLAPGVTRALVFHPMKPGSYKFFDEFHADTAQGRIVAK